MALNFFESKENVIPADTETKRLYALILLSQGKFVEAEKVIEEAWNENSDWTGVRLAKAIIYYHTSLSPQILSENALAFAEPQPWNLIRTDRQSREKRKIAADLFASILSLEQRNDEEQRIIESWYLACLANDPTRQIEASEYCQNILDSHPTQIYLIIWALARNLSVDFNRAETRLEENLNDADIASKPAINDSLVLIALFLRNGKVTKAKRQLAKIKPVLEDAAENSLAAYWTCQIVLAEGNTKLVEEKLSQKIQDVNMRQRVQVAALMVEYNKSPNRKTQRKLTKRLQKLYRKTQDVYYLMFYCQICHSQPSS